MEEAKGKSGGNKKMVLGLLVGVVVAGGGTAGVFAFLGKPSASAAAAAPRKDPGPIEKLQPFVVNLRDSGVNRYLKATVELELGSAKDVERIKKFEARIRHSILLYLSSLSRADVQGDAGKQAMIADVLKRVRAAYTGGEVVSVYLTELVVQ